MCSVCVIWFCTLIYLICFRIIVYYSQLFGVDELSHRQYLGCHPKPEIILLAHNKQTHFIWRNVTFSLLCINQNSRATASLENFLKRLNKSSQAPPQIPIFIKDVYSNLSCRLIWWCNWVKEKRSNITSRVGEHRYYKTANLPKTF